MDKDTQNRNNFLKKDHDFIRVGNKFFKKIESEDIDGIKRTELLRRDRQLIIDDNEKGFLRHIPTYDKFTTKPDNINYEQKIGTLYNLYNEFSHKPKEGNCDTTLKFIKHIFGDQYELGLDYLTLLYKNPTQKLPILALVSIERNTGKTSFLDWIGTIFGANAIIIRNADLANNFNFAYAHANIVMIDEALIKGDKVPEKLKELATARQIMLEAKGVDGYLMPWFGKLILTGNKEDDLVKIDAEEDRYWIRKIPTITEDRNPNFLADLIIEIPAFIHFINERKMHIPESPYRHWFNPAILTTPQLSKIKETSKSKLYKSILENIHSYFGGLEQSDTTRNFLASGKDIEKEFYSKNNAVSTNEIHTVLKKEMHFETQKQQRYYPFNRTVYKYFAADDRPGQTELHSRSGKPYLFDKSEINELYNTYIDSVSV
jgi:hypothetical protein